MSKMTIEKMRRHIAGTKFEEDLGHMLSVNNGQMPRGVWNLVCSIRDVKLYSKGIKPHRNWRISDVKWYFGIKGNATNMAITLEEYRDLLYPKQDEEGGDE